MSCRHVTSRAVVRVKNVKPTLLEGSTTRKQCFGCFEENCSLWVCVTCGEIGCGRYDGGHAQAHHQESNHPVAMSLDSLDLHCYTCDADVIDSSRAIDELRQAAISVTVQAPIVDHTRGRVLDAPGARGLLNGGNTCYLNAVVQALTHTVPFRDFLMLLPFHVATHAIAPCNAQAVALGYRSRRSAAVLSGRKLDAIARPFSDSSLFKRSSTPLVQDESVTTVLRSVTRHLWMPTDVLLSAAEYEQATGVVLASKRVSTGALLPAQVLSLESMLAAIWRCMPKFSGYQQQDAHEFLRILLDRIDIEMRRIDGATLPPSMDEMVASMRRNAAALPVFASPQSRVSSPLHRPDDELGGTTAANSDDGDGDSSVGDDDSLSNPPPTKRTYAGRSRTRRGAATRSSDRNGHEESDEPDPVTPVKREQSRKCALVKPLFGATLLSTVRCNGCRQQSKLHELHYDMSLDVPDDEDGAVTLHSCLERYISPCKLDKADKYKCGRCRRPQVATKSVAMHTLPPILCLHLKRFRWQPPLPPKLDTLVTFEEMLDVAPYMDRDALAAARKARTPTMYRLFAAVNHIGKSCASGHYTAHCRERGPTAAAYAEHQGADPGAAFVAAGNDESAGARRGHGAGGASGSELNWLHYDDRVVGRVAFDDVVTSDAYMLFYEQVDVQESRAAVSSFNEELDTVAAAKMYQRRDGVDEEQYLERRDSSSLGHSEEIDIMSVEPPAKKQKSSRGRPGEGKPKKPKKKAATPKSGGKPKVARVKKVKKVNIDPLTGEPRKRGRPRKYPPPPTDE